MLKRVIFIGSRGFVAIEKIWKEIPPVLIKRDSPFLGGVAIDEKAPFREGMVVVLSADTLPNLQLKVRRVADGVIYVSDLNSTEYKDVSSYTVALNSKITAHEQTRDPITEKDQSRDRYERGPVNADRNVLVDKAGDYFDESNPVPVEVQGTINAESNPIKNPHILNINVPLANIEQVITIPMEAITFMIKVRNGDSKMIYSFVEGQSSIEFATIERGCFYKETGLDLMAPLNIYFQTTKSNQVIEVLYWT